MGGVGQPRLQKILFNARGQAFEEVMAALGSNTREQRGNGQGNGKAGGDGGLGGGRQLVVVVCVFLVTYTKVFLAMSGAIDALSGSDNKVLTWFT